MISLPFNLNRATLLYIALAFVGLLLLLGGVFYLVRSYQDETSLEIIPSSPSVNISDNKNNITVDIEGAVLKPGVYELNSGSRLEDLLIKAGGLSLEANRDWVEKSLNRAQKLEDGAKVYIPKTDETTKAGTTSGVEVKGMATSDLINVNSATEAQLDTLWGVGPATATKIIQNRPYTKVEDLLSKKVLKSNVYNAVKDQLIVY